VQPTPPSVARQAAPIRPVAAAQRVAPAAPIRAPVRQAPVKAATPPVRTAALPRKEAAAPRPSTSGSITVQVAAVRSRSEAERLVARLTKGYSSQLGTRRPSIEETVYGNMGTFYRVEVGPFTKQADTGSLCQSLKSAGYDCLITTK
ncbi:MAG: SPOR domain-containing protein, partial [Pseudomonadota bacterium]